MKREIRLAERTYVRSQIVNSKGNTNSIWKVINGCLPKKSPSLPQFNDGRKKIANSFNKYFASVGRLQLLKPSSYLRTKIRLSSIQSLTFLR